MRFTQWKFGLLSVVLFCGRVAAQTEAQVRVLVYAHARAPASVVDKAGIEAERIFRAAGIDLRWVSCTGHSEAVECHEGPARGQLVLHIVPTGKITSDSAYGEAFLADDGAGKYADIFFDRVAAAHREVDSDVSRLLGAVAAHEIGHLLLGLHSHSWVGIMAPMWDTKSLQQIEMGELFFTREQRLRMKKRMRGSEMSVASLDEKMKR
jgi:hypothetical protein